MTDSTIDNEARQEVAHHADEAVRVVRIVLAVLACFVVGAYRPIAESRSGLSLALVLIAIVSTALGLNWMAKSFERTPMTVGVVQVLDVISTIGLAVVLDGPLGQQSWVLLVVPVVSAAVRISAAASVLSWLGGSAGYMVAALTGIVTRADDMTVLARIPGTLLAVAVTIGLLARWMREGWEIQNGLTAVVAEREQRLAVIERTSHAMRNLSSEEALAMCADQVLELGFDAATVEDLTSHEILHTVGRGDIIAAVEGGEAPNSEGPTVTLWMDGEHARVHSVSVHEIQSNMLITGWVESAVDPELARALAGLVAQTSAAIQTSTVLEELRRSASHDPLTGLANRRRLEDELSTLAGVDGGRLAIAFIDVDDFKTINDEHGHQVGDKVLIAVARRIEAVAGASSIAARYGGDEFVVLMPGIGAVQARVIADAILAAFSDPVALGTSVVRVGLSIGVASSRTPIAVPTLVEAADVALYEAKAAGKAGVVATHLDDRSSQPATSS